MRGAAMIRSITGKAEVVLEYPDKLFIGTFDRNDHFDARFEANEVLLTLQREDGTEACRAARLHLAPQVLARVLFELADSASETAPAAANRVALRAAARTLEGALAALEACPRTVNFDQKARDRLVAQAGYALWLFVVQREACGLNDSVQMMRNYRVPQEVYARMGPLARPRVRTPRASEG